mmetsp:Transcript_30633/g.48008  ORF Transcript_30633/g.48008 Transcript_30633/m.48008 type:complete len:135 (+) Transcript_30633:911-1315(+)
MIQCGVHTLLPMWMIPGELPRVPRADGQPKTRAVKRRLWGDRLVTLSLLQDSVMGFVSNDHEVRVPMPRRSVLIMSGNARYTWQHGIRRTDIVSRRVSVTCRELSDDFKPGGNGQEQGDRILAMARRCVDAWDA